MIRPRILLAEDHTIVREGLIRLLSDEFDVVGDVGDGHALAKAIERLSPDVIVSDIGMPLLNGIESFSRVREIAPEAKIVFLTQYSGKEYVEAAFRLGASAYILKSAATLELITGIRAVLNGTRFISSELQSRVGDVLSAKPSSSKPFGDCLTPRQREVLQLIAEGKIAKEIAYVLDISVKTVEFRKSTIMERLGVRSTAELTRYAIEHGISQ